MWRKATDAKPSSAPSSPLPAEPQPVASRPAPEPVSPPVVPQPVRTLDRLSVPQSPPERTVATNDGSGISRIGAGLKIRGDVSGTSDLFIDGEAQGKIRLIEGRVTVGPQGKVQADIEAREIVIEGSVQGNLKAGESVRLGPSSRVQGSVLTPRIGIEDGAVLRGKVEMTRATESSRPAVSAQTTEAEILRAVSAHSESE